VNKRYNAEFHFSDPTILESEGDFDETNKIMEAELWKEHKWMIETGLMVKSEASFSEMTLHLYYDKNVIIIDYKSSEGDVFYNPDIQSLSIWCREHGWNLPQPYVDLIKTDIDFWKHFWDVCLVDSPYFDEKFGKRTVAYNDTEENEEEEKEND